MVALTDEQRIIVGLDILKQMCQEEDVDCTQVTVRDAVLAAASAADQWTDDNQVSYNTALPEPFRTWATPRQKAQVLAYVLLHRFNLDVS
jgi:hypothetical protein